MTLKKCALPLALALLVGSVWICAAEQAPSQAKRGEFEKALAAGNFQIAYDGFRKLALAPDDDPLRVSGDLQNGIQALQNLGRVDEIDEFREAVIEKHSGNWRLLEAADGAAAGGTSMRPSATGLALCN